MADKMQANVDEGLKDALFEYSRFPSDENRTMLISFLESTRLDNMSFSSMLNSSSFSFDNFTRQDYQEVANSLHQHQNDLSEKLLEKETRCAQILSRIDFLKEQVKRKKSNIKSHGNPSRHEATSMLLRSLSDTELQIKEEEKQNLPEFEREREIARENHLRFQGMAEMLLSKIESSNSFGASKRY